ncbi:hypothetical protein LTR36_004852 [Oleoguttula mirabilis]|uniref:F-box domain-containing protein n=1 Tax=Oleoguttula mirabilis TaxID=1507867 RepID=A0AAV9JG75_9PEZI|nr:hypothetical protein LTR36_004852 [Oleoguttula mirabilis]
MRHRKPFRLDAPTNAQEIARMNSFIDNIYDKHIMSSNEDTALPNDGLLSPTSLPPIVTLPKELLDDIFERVFTADVLPRISIDSAMAVWKDMLRPFRVHPYLFTVALKEPPKYTIVQLDLGDALLDRFANDKGYLMKWAPRKTISTSILNRIVHLHLTVPLGGVRIPFSMPQHVKLAYQAFYVLRNLKHFFPALRTLYVKLNIATLKVPFVVGDPVIPPVIRMWYQPTDVLGQDEAAVRASIEEIVAILQRLELRDVRLASTPYRDFGRPGDWEMAAKELANVVKRMFAEVEGGKAQRLI